MARDERAQDLRVGEVSLPRVYGEVRNRRQWRHDRGHRIRPRPDVPRRARRFAHDPQSDDPPAAGWRRRIRIFRRSPVWAAPSSMRASSCWRTCASSRTARLTRSSTARSTASRPRWPRPPAVCSRRTVAPFTISPAASSSTTVSSCATTSPTMTSGGGAVRMDGGSFTTRNGTYFSGNFSVTAASVIAMFGGTLDVSETTFDDNWHHGHRHDGPGSDRDHRRFRHGGPEHVPRQPRCRSRCDLRAGCEPHGHAQHLHPEPVSQQRRGGCRRCAGGRRSP